MAAYAALASLMNTMDQIQLHPRFSTSFNMNHFLTLGHTVGVLLDFIESYNCGGSSKEVEDLEGQIACAAHAAEDVMESHVVNQIIAGSTKKKSTWMQKMMRWVRKEMCDLQKVMEDMDSIKEYAIGRFRDRRLIIPSTVPPAASSRAVSAGKTSMVGFDDDLIHLMDKLTGKYQSHLLFIPIIGMGGVGKTTLARNAFENSLIKQHFDVRAWTTISQNYSTREILLEILLQLLSNIDQEAIRKLVALNEQEVGEKLHKYLFNRRYLIVLDDIWSIDVWNEIKFFFPENNNNSGIVVTTRLLNIALDFNSSYHTVNLLDVDNSWNLFCQESFGEEGCPAELEEVGKKICENCNGLPLSIVVIGGFLRRSSKSREYWEDVARDTYSILNSEGDNQCLNILSLSYNHLPAHLKPCFLYMGVFAEDEEISVSRLVRLWVAEGFLIRNGAQSLEEVAEGYLKDLVGRNLVLVKRWGSTGKMRACNIHDLIRELCLSIAEKEKFFSGAKLVGTPGGMNKECRIVIHESTSKQRASVAALGSASFVRSLICKGRVSFDFKLLRVLRAADVALDTRFLDIDLSCVNLRCLDRQFVRSNRYLPSRYLPKKIYLPSRYLPKKISLLWNLQTVSIKGYSQQITATSQLWDMVQLKHLQVDNLYIPDPPENDRVDLVLPNLHTLRMVKNFQLSEEVCRRIPNVKKLHLEYDEIPSVCDSRSYYCSQNLGRFHKLESLTLTFGGVNRWRLMQLNMTFPTSLKKLTLCGGDLYWEDLEMIGSLPNLEVLKLQAWSVSGSEWNMGEGEFRSLKFLQIHGCESLTKWNADHFHFPVLEKLVLGFLSRLDEIPLVLGEILTLKLIQMRDCSASGALSAVKILEEQESVGNEDLQVEIGFYGNYTDDKDRFREMMEEEAFTSNNLHIMFR